MTTEEIKKGVQNLYALYIIEISALEIELEEAQNTVMAKKLIEELKLPTLLELDQEDDGAVLLRSVAKIEEDIKKRKDALPVLYQLISDHSALVAIRSNLDKR